MNFNLRYKSLVFVVAVCFIGAIQAQESSFFKVEFDAFSPPTKDMIMSFEGKEPLPFLANDIDGTEHFLKNYKGKVVFVYL